jgi:hypothetical protein
MNTYEYYNKILEDHKNDYAFLTRLEVTDNINGIEQNLTSDEKAFLVCAISQYWLDEDLQENTLFDITWLAVQNHLEKLSCSEFVDKMDELV